MKYPAMLLLLVQAGVSLILGSTSKHKLSKLMLIYKDIKYCKTPKIAVINNLNLNNVILLLQIMVFFHTNFYTKVLS